jgi:hypothetical protein
MADGVVPLDLGYLSSRGARLGPVGAAYTRSGIVVATDGSLKKSGATGAAYVAKDNRLWQTTACGGHTADTQCGGLWTAVVDVERDARVRDLVQRAAKHCVTRILQPKRGRTGVEASPPTLPLTAAWMLWPNQGRCTLGQVLGEMRISTAKKQLLQSIAGAFPGNAVLHKS